MLLCASFTIYGTFYRWQFLKASKRCCVWDTLLPISLSIAGGGGTYSTKINRKHNDQFSPDSFYYWGTFVRLYSWSTAVFTVLLAHKKFIGGSDLLSFNGCSEEVRRESRSKFGDGRSDVLQGGSCLGGGESLDSLQSLVAMVTAQVHSWAHTFLWLNRCQKLHKDGSTC